MMIYLRFIGISDFLNNIFHYAKRREKLNSRYKWFTIRRPQNIVIAIIKTRKEKRDREIKVK